MCQIVRTRTVECGGILALKNVTAVLEVGLDRREDHIAPRHSANGGE